MSKVSSSYPDYSKSNVSLGGSSASTGVQNGALNSSYDMSDGEAAIYNYALSTLANILPSLNTFDQDTMSSIQSQVDAYKNAGLEKINDIYNPLISNLQNDIASRFGNLDNSVFTDNLADIESERADSVSSFAQDILAKQSELESDELTKRYALVNLLSGLSNDIYGNALDAISTALNGSSNANNYNSAVYDALSSVQNTNSGNTTDDLMTTLLSLASNSKSYFNYL